MHVEYIRTSRLRLMGSGRSWQNFPHEHFQRVMTACSLQPSPAESMSPSLRNSETALNSLYLLLCSFINRMCNFHASAIPELRVRAQGALNVTLISCVSITCSHQRRLRCYLLRLFSRFFRQIQMIASHHNRSSAGPSSPYLISMSSTLKQFLNRLGTDHQVFCIQQLPWTACMELQGWSL